MNLRILFLSVCLMVQLGCMGQGRFHVMKMERNAVRIRYTLAEGNGSLQTSQGEACLNGFMWTIATTRATTLT